MRSDKGNPECFSLSCFSGWRYPRGYPIVTMLGWNGKRYIDQTRRYPRWAFQEARKHQEAIRKLLKQHREIWEDNALEGMVAGYYANMLATGRGEGARRWLRKHLPKEAPGWLKQYDREMRSVVANAVRRYIEVHQEKVVEIYPILRSPEPL